jgi:ferredoxin
VRVTIDQDKCEGHGECTLIAPDVFELDDDALVSRVLVPEPDESRQAAVRDAEMMCPTSAIRVEG